MTLIAVPVSTRLLETLPAGWISTIRRTDGLLESALKISILDRISVHRRIIPGREIRRSNEIFWRTRPMAA